MTRIKLYIQIYDITQEEQIRKVPYGITKLIRITIESP